MLKQDGTRRASGVTAYLILSESLLVCHILEGAGQFGKIELVNLKE